MTSQKFHFIVVASKIGQCPSKKLVDFFIKLIESNTFFDKLSNFLNKLSKWAFLNKFLKDNFLHMRKF